jgi:hypothetical protein
VRVRFPLEGEAEAIRAVYEGLWSSLPVAPSPRGEA